MCPDAIDLWWMEEEVDLWRINQIFIFGQKVGKL